METEKQPATRQNQAGTLRILQKVFPVTVPVLTGYVCLGIAYGILMGTNGYGVAWTALMSALIYAGSIQFLGINLLLSAFDPIQALLLSFMVNARHIFYGLSLLERYKGIGKARPYLIFSLTDETFSLVSSLQPPEEVEPRAFYFWVSLLNHAYWVLGGVLGSLAGSLITFNTAGMDFALTALFVVLFLEQWKHKSSRPAGVVGLVCSAACVAVFGPDNMVIPAMALISLILIGGRKQLCR